MVSNVAMTEFTSSAVVVFAMQKLKTAKWFPLIQDGRVWVNRLISIGGAGIVAIGVNYTWSPETRGLLITVPTLSAALVALWHWLNQYALNETLYQATAGRNSNGNGSAPVTTK